ncbi:RsmB/NOP family class I SAM-dependent RNA methyltransferase [Gymnodinialimonas ceratoperidinii]|uniref:16S rRNA methyltransferase n=1 Tax=Gymnodinialimonas ceratoperidinii TaxID=2856823 RepID=A0A8F6TYR7_9RHOB|nr:RsmB/NOP family class I SAM-dependent RNA methyltransferase [Gymnodinialimonas ceratoperidinii]QXT40186.1 16S rRNA methyltransferase [Gymnodinialimonas ceratoperidinii]
MKARPAALILLNAVLRDRQILGQVEVPAVGAEAARANRLALAVLRNLGAVDALLRPYTQRKPQIGVHNILRLGAVELLVNGEDAHGVVSDLVGIAKTQPQTRKAQGMVNAILRKVATEGPEAWAKTQPQRLPPWLDKALRKRIGAEGIKAIEAAQAQVPPIDLTPRDSDFTLEGADVLPTGSLRLHNHPQVSALPGYADGKFWVQDAAAALPVKLLGDVAGKSVLDICAAPGGKTMQLAAAGAEVTALDISGPRMKRVAENLGRTQLSANLVTEDALHHQGSYDAILLDAPCSATGTIRRHPDLPFVKTGDEIEPLTKLQMQLIDHALTLLKPGGTLVYCTCSLLPVEGEFQIKAALKRHEDLSVVPTDPVALGGEPHWASEAGGLRLWPSYWADKGGMDGFYMAALRRS